MVQRWKDCAEGLERRVDKIIAQFRQGSMFQSSDIPTED